MQMSDTRQIAVAPSEVYAALLDPDMLKNCVPGAQEVTGSVEDGFEATVVQKVGPVKATFKGEVTISDLVPNTSLKIDGSGKGGAAGFAKGGAEVRLAEKDGGTEFCLITENVIAGSKSEKSMAQGSQFIVENFKLYVETGKVSFGARIQLALYSLMAPMTPKAMHVDNWPHF